jgi:hypothetical protein
MGTVNMSVIITVDNNFKILSNASHIPRTKVTPWLPPVLRTGA